MRIDYLGTKKVFQQCGLRGTRIASVSFTDKETNLFSKVEDHMVELGYHSAGIIGALGYCVCDFIVEDRDDFEFFCEEFRRIKKELTKKGEYYEDSND